MSVTAVKREIERNGWVALPDSAAPGLIALAGKLGSSATVRWLRAQNTGDARASRSLSSLHGRGSFPPHTDGAGRLQPARFVALLSERSYQAATLLYDGNDAALVSPEFSRSWLVSDGGRRFYAVPRRRVRGRIRWRLNPDIMFPAGGDAELESALEPFGRMAKVRIEWEPGMAVIWDNHRMLHARESVGAKDGERSLLRVLVSE
jgi:hypothetical protein